MTTSEAVPLNTSSRPRNGKPLSAAVVVQVLVYLAGIAEVWHGQGVMLRTKASHAGSSGFFRYPSNQQPVLGRKRETRLVNLEEIQAGASIRGLTDGVADIVSVRPMGSAALEVVYRDESGQVRQRLLYRTDEPTLSLVSGEMARSFSADGHLFRLVSEARRIQLAYLFDPHLAVTTSLVEPLPHQITAVYGEMLPRQPLRFLLADDPGAGKTIMAGLLIKELMVRGDIQRCMVVCPGSLVEQWQDELWSKFQLPFEIMTNDKIEAARTGNWFSENPFAICRLDKLARDERLHDQMTASDWDLVICDEAHKMSASVFGNEVSYTRRYHLGELVAAQTRNLLLLTATPHNGREANFRLFLRLLDADRFEGSHRLTANTTDVSDMMRRLVKEQMLKFDGTPLFPERRAYSVNYELSEAEQELYEDVTGYVRNEFNRADKLSGSGRNTIGFALTVLQRRLASSPEAIYQSIRRRRERLEGRLEELVSGEGTDHSQGLLAWGGSFTGEDLEDYEDAPGEEFEEQEARLLDEATAATTATELQAEIETLSELESVAGRVRASGDDRKWEELSRILQEQPEMRNPDGSRRKLVIFTEHVDTLRYLYRRITTMFGREDGVVVIYGGVNRNERRAAQESFRNDPTVQILIATDAAGEGINLQNAHLMVNYDLPWNPNRLEQRFGRIHRIGQTEVCHLWNLIANETREGAVFQRLFEKIAQMRQSLGGGVFDILGKVFRDERLEDLLKDAIRYGERPDVQARLVEKVDNLLEQETVRELLEERALVRNSMDTSQIARIREDMDRAEARRLQPHHISGFFREAFTHLGGRIQPREAGRYEISRIPHSVRQVAEATRARDPLPARYERVTFDKQRIGHPGRADAAFICPGHPLLDSVTTLVMDRYRSLLREGALFVDPDDPGEDARLLVYLEHAIEDGRQDATGERSVTSRQYQFVELHEDGSAADAGYAPFLDYRPADDSERDAVQLLLGQAWVSESVEERAIQYAVEEVVPRHVEDLRSQRDELVRKTMAAVRERMTHEIQYWGTRFVELKAQEEAGKTPRTNSAQARQRMEELEARRDQRLRELEQERQLAPLPPVVIGAAVVIPQGLLTRIVGADEPDPGMSNNPETERIAMDAVMEAERALGFTPKDIADEKRGYDIESRTPDGRLRFVEVKGRQAGASNIFVTRNEILTCLNKPDQFILAIVQVEDGAALAPRYVRQPFTQDLDFTAMGVNHHLQRLLEMSTEPS